MGRPNEPNYDAFQYNAFQWDAFQMDRPNTYEGTYGRRAGRPAINKDIERKRKIKNLIYLLASIEEEL